LSNPTLRSHLITNRSHGGDYIPLRWWDVNHASQGGRYAL